MKVLLFNNVGMRQDDVTRNDVSFFHVSLANDSMQDKNQFLVDQNGS
jgi:hypothetical protein